MRHSSLLLALSLALHVFDNHATEATAGTVNDPNKAHTFLHIKNDTRPQGSYEDDERMFRPILEKIRSVFSEETPEAYFEKILKGAVGTSAIEKVNSGLQNMKPKEMERVVKAYKSEYLWLADKFIVEWGIEAVATALVKARLSENENIKENGVTLTNDLMDSFEKTARGDNQKVLARLELNDKDRALAGFIDGRVELLHDFFTYNHDGLGRDQAFFLTLKDRFGGEMFGYANLAHIISEAVAMDRAAKSFELRFVKHLVANVDITEIFTKLRLTRFEYKLFQRPEYEMVKTFFVLNKLRQSQIPDNMLLALIKAYGKDNGALALMLSKGVENNDLASKDYELRFFQYLRRDYDPIKIKSIFTDDKRETDPALKFVERYQQWYNN